MYELLFLRTYLHKRRHQRIFVICVIHTLSAAQKLVIFFAISNAILVSFFPLFIEKLTESYIIMNQEKLARLQSMQSMQRIGGKGTPRRTTQKKSLVPKIVEDKKLSTCLKKLNAHEIHNVESTAMFKEDGEVMHFSKPQVQFVKGGVWAINGKHENKTILELMPEIIPQLGVEQTETLKQLTEMD